MSELKLLPCPFCGGEAAVCDIKEPSVNGWVGCQRCRCFIDWVKNGKSLAIAAWNRRSAPNHVGEANAMIQPDNEPLTMEELRKMRGQMVDVPESDFWIGGSGIIADDRVYNPEDEDGYWPFEYYGEWLAYRYKKE